jgi:WD40 repeat protein
MRRHFPARWPRFACGCGLLVSSACGGDSPPTSTPPPASSGSIEISTLTTGQLIDVDGYTVAVGQSVNRVIAANSTLLVSGLSPGTYTVALSGVAANCSVSGQNSIAVTVAAATAQARFEVACGVATGELITFMSDRDGNFELYVMKSDGTGVVRLTNHPGVDSQAAWSPDGSKIAFSSEGGGRADVWVMNFDGSGLSNLTSGRGGYLQATDRFPAWRP